MKKVIDLAKPFLAIILGALLFFYYLDYLSFSGKNLAIGIIAIVIASYYLASGVIEILLASKLSAGLRKVLGIVTVSIYPTFMFVYFLLRVIDLHSTMGPTSWVIYILCMLASLSVVAVYVVSKFVKGQLFVRLSCLLGIVFVLALVSSILFPLGVVGRSAYIGEIEIVPVLTHITYCALLYSSLAKEKAE